MICKEVIRKEVPCALSFRQLPICSVHKSLKRDGDLGVTFSFMGFSLKCVASNKGSSRTLFVMPWGSARDSDPRIALGIPTVPKIVKRNIMNKRWNRALKQGA